MGHRMVVLDTETTGLDPAQGHRIIEIGCVELIKRRPSGNVYHQYINPQRDIDAGAIEVHGIKNEFLLDKPKFANIVDDFIDFIKGAELIIHNAPFDVGFINSELLLLDAAAKSVDKICGVLDTLVLAREIHPGQRNSLDALCKRYEIDNSRREKHGALLDAEILADVFLAMTGGQTDLLLDATVADNGKNNATSLVNKKLNIAGLDQLRIIKASEEEQKAHQQKLEKINKVSNGECLWLQRDI